MEAPTIDYRAYVALANLISASVVINDAPLTYPQWLNLSGTEQINTIMKLTELIQLQEGRKPSGDNYNMIISLSVSRDCKENIKVLASLIELIKNLIMKFDNLPSEFIEFVENMNIEKLLIYDFVNTVEIRLNLMAELVDELVREQNNG